MFYTVLKCPVGLDCGEILEIDACRQIVPMYLISMWDDAICESMLDASQKFYCPYKDCSSLMVNDGGEMIRGRYAFPAGDCCVVHCNVPWHSGVGCEWIDQNERRVEDLIVHQLAKEIKWQRCPR
ncbi:E3 ubiquitin-protein ligase RSL1-like [Primulina huaijiensis]|uniref:E3 ubiquitin-protein ligase RSL1-like n=1 Tax=Primulina huaijiensis TaxID=1492673 RepID=UPI003CC781C9